MIEIKRPSLIVFALLVVALAGAGAIAFQDGQAPKDSTEPQRQYQVDIDGQAFDLPLNQPTEINLNGKAHRVTLRVKPYVKFVYNGVAFEVPQQFSYTLDDSDPLLKMWDISSGDASLMLQSYEQDMSAQMLAAMLVPGIKSQFQGLQVGEEPVAFKYGNNQTLQGTRLSINLPDVIILQEIYVFEHREKSYALILQDAREFNRGASKEYTQVYKHLQESLKLWD